MEMPMPCLALTPQFIKSVQCPNDTPKIDFHDEVCRGMMLEVRRSGGKTYSLRYSDARGNIRQQKLAKEDDVTLAQARVLADKMRTQVALGDDPKVQKAELKKVPTVEEFARDSYMPHVKGYKRSWRCDEGLFRLHILPVWGKRYMDEITLADIAKMMAEHRKEHAPGTCNRLLVHIRFMFNLALIWKTPGVKENPTAEQPFFRNSNKMQRFLTHDEAADLYREVAQSNNRMLQYIVPMLLLTGARKREVLDAKWEDFDVEHRSWCIPINKSGEPRYVPLSESVVALLESVPRLDNCLWAFPNPDSRKPYACFFPAWNKARRKAGLSDVRVHDLRHSFASFLVNSGRTLYEVQRILGHRSHNATRI
jgi:integrase